ncbi:MAG: glycosyltransferase family 1 protein, partial [Leuconostoc sp.]|nr:glycosyltransferase family 1 protein [Leuconostoc sp.]
MMNILYLHVGAEMYGSDKVLYQLVTNIDKTKFTPFVVLPEHGKLEQALLEEHINVSVIPYPIMRRSFFSPYGVIRYVYQFLLSSRKLARFAREKKVKLIHVNTIAVLEGVYFKLFTKLPVLWH